MHRDLRIFIPKCKDIITLRHFIDKEQHKSEKELQQKKEAIIKEDRSLWGIDVHFIAENNIDLKEILRSPNITKRFLLKDVG